MAARGDAADSGQAGEVTRTVQAVLNQLHAQYVFKPRRGTPTWDSADEGSETDVSIPEGYDFDLPTMGFVGGEDDQSFVNRAAAAALAELHTRYELVPRTGHATSEADEFHEGVVADQFESGRYRATQAPSVQPVQQTAPECQPVVPPSIWSASRSNLWLSPMTRQDTIILGDGFQMLCAGSKAHVEDLKKPASRQDPVEKSEAKQPESSAKGHDLDPHPEPGSGDSNPFDTSTTSTNVEFLALIPKPDKKEEKKEKKERQRIEKKEKEERKKQEKERQAREKEERKKQEKERQEREKREKEERKKEEKEEKERQRGNRKSFRERYRDFRVFGAFGDDGTDDEYCVAICCFPVYAAGAAAVAIATVAAFPVIMAVMAGIGIYQLGGVVYRVVTCQEKQGPVEFIFNS